MSQVPETVTLPDVVSELVKKPQVLVCVKEDQETWMDRFQAAGIDVQQYSFKFLEPQEAYDAVRAAAKSGTAIAAVITDRGTDKANVSIERPGMETEIRHEELFPGLLREKGKNINLALVGIGKQEPEDRLTDSVPFRKMNIFIMSEGDVDRAAQQLKSHLDNLKKRGEAPSPAGAA